MLTLYVVSYIPYICLAVYLTLYGVYVSPCLYVTINKSGMRVEAVNPGHRDSSNSLYHHSYPLSLVISHLSHLLSVTHSQRLVLCLCS